MTGTIRQHVGRCRERLAERLAAVDIEVFPDQILGVQGGERSCDCARWETINARKDGNPAHVFSWSTMTDCARYGVELSRDNGPHGWGSYEAHAIEMAYYAARRRKQKTIRRATLVRLALCNSDKCPEVINEDGRRKRWIGIGWVDEGPARGDETVLVD